MSSNYIKIGQVSINLFVQVGELTEKKRARLIKQVKLGQAVNTPVGIGFINNENSENVIINPDRITYTKLGYYIDKEKVTLLLNTLIDVLMLDEKNFALIDIQGLSDTDDSHTESINTFNNKFSDTLYKYGDIYGVGYRFLFKDENANGEIKIEPFIRDSSKYFYHYIENINENKMNIDKIIEITDNAINNLDEKYKSIIEMIIKR